MDFQEPASDPDHGGHHFLSGQVCPSHRLSESDVDVVAGATCKDHLPAELEHFSQFLPPGRAASNFDDGTPDEFSVQDSAYDRRLKPRLGNPAEHDLYAARPSLNGIPSARAHLRIGFHVAVCENQHGAAALKVVDRSSERS